MGPSRRSRSAFLVAVLAAAVAACGSDTTTVPPPFVPGTVAAPREVNIVARDYLFEPAPIELVPGETVLLHVLDAGLAVHEVVIGDAGVQAAWETAEAVTASAPPGPTPVVSVPPGSAGLRVVVRSGERVDVVWTVPTAPDPLIVGCHIPGHWARGMQTTIRFVAPNGSPAASAGAGVLAVFGGRGRAGDTLLTVPRSVSVGSSETLSLGEDTNGLRDR